MLHPTDINDLDAGDLASPLTKDDVTKHFPPDFDCSQLLFNHEKFLWIQYVPAYKRYLPQQYFYVSLRHALIVGLGIVLFVIGIQIDSGSRADEYTHSVKIEYIAASIIFLLLEVLMVYREFGGYMVDIATNVRIFHAVIYPTVVCCETISYKSIEQTKYGNSYLRFANRTLSKSSGIAMWVKKNFGNKFYLTYIPENNSWIKSNISTLIANAATEAAALAQTEDAMQKLEDNTPSRNTEIPQTYRTLAEGVQGDDMVWGYRPTPFEKKRSTTIQVVVVVVYFIAATLGLVVPLLRVVADYSMGLVNFIVVVWVLYFVAMIVLDTEFNEMVTLNTLSIASFTTRLSFFSNFPRIIQCGKRVTRLSYRSVYPLYSYLYRTPNATPVEYQYLRKIQALEAKILGYTDGSGAIQFPNNLTLRVPNVHDVEWAILQKHYHMERFAIADRTSPDRVSQRRMDNLPLQEPPRDIEMQDEIRPDPV